MMDSEEIGPTAQFKMREWCAPEAWMIGASTRLLDCWEPQVEWLRMPSLRWMQTTVEASAARGRLPGTGARPLARHLSRPSRRIELDGDTFAVDLRPLGGWNIAHAVVSGVPRYLAAAHAASRSQSNARSTAIVPEDVSPYVRAAYEIFGIPMLATNADIIGRSIKIEMTDHEAIALSCDLLPHRVRTLLEDQSTTMPRKVFLARRGSRAILNMTVLEQMLEHRGFTTIYPENLSVLDQFRLLWQAEEVVGVHGAALALLLPRVLQQPRRPLHLVEIFGPGYVVSLYRCLAAAIGANWIGIRGRLSPEVVRDLEYLAQHDWRYRATNALRGRIPARWLRRDSAWQRTHQATNFEIDPTTLELALEAVRYPERPPPERVWN